MSKTRLLALARLHEKCSNIIFSGPYFSVFRPEKTPYLDTFYALQNIATKPSYIFKYFHSDMNQTTFSLINLCLYSNLLNSKLHSNLI